MPSEDLEGRREDEPSGIDEEKAPSVTPPAIQRLRHDLRTPLNAIINYTEMLQEVAEQELQPDLGRVHASAHTLVGLIDRAFAEVVTMVAPAHGDRGTRGARSAPTTTQPPPRHSLAPSTLAGGDEHVAPSPHAGASLLVVDDNEENRAVLERRLSRRGFVVTTADGGEPALRAIHERSFDLVILDVVMPGMNGLEVLARIRETLPVDELPIIMATARDGSQDIVQALERGANDYVTKPVDLSVLLARVHAQLALKEAGRRIRNLASQLEARNKFIREAFGRYLTDEVVERLLSTPGGLALGGESRCVTILMSDLRGFSSLSERLTPPEVVTMLNTFLGAMTEVIVKHGGTIDEFIGDAIMVIFGAPVAHEDHALRAVACAVEMQLAIPGVNARNVAAGLPAIEMGIGINTGEVVVGNIGSGRRAKYGVVGRNVNLASRIESLTVGGEVLISEVTRDAAGPAVDIEGARSVALKGARGLMKVFEVRGLGGDPARTLPRPAESLVELSAPIAARYAVFDGVNAPVAMSAGAVSALSRSGARLHTSEALPLMATLKLQLGEGAARGGADGAGAADGPDAYAKVLRDADGGYILRFTAAPPEVDRAVVELLSTARR